jgi:hypothetical protein
VTNVSVEKNGMNIVNVKRAAKKSFIHSTESQMKAFLITTGTVFGLIVIAHLARVHAESQMALLQFQVAKFCHS